ncbi:MAG: transcription termination factor NusA [Candidatus Margulisbacteria bacterium]|nr:transcription termination factor NusA [Candidatus Margulisiibacteriota bacterium]
MIKIPGLHEVVNQIQAERGISKEDVLQAIKDALVMAAKRYHGTEENLKAVLDEKEGEGQIFVTKTVVKVVEDPMFEISLKEAKEYDPKVKNGQDIEIQFNPPEFGRIAAQKAKQVIMQRIIESEKNSIFEEYKDRIGNLIIGVVQRKEGKNYLINLGRTEAILDLRNQIPGEEYRIKDRIKLFFVEIIKTNRGPEVIVSRSHEGFVKKMFELEVPEIQQGVIEIKSIARKAGYRTKIAVKSNDEQVGAVGTCVGRMGARIQTILKEINGEKVDIVEWSEDPEVFIANSLKPATVVKVEIVDEENRKARALVDDEQLSLAIGKGGLNVRLASKLVGWSIDVTKKGDLESNLLEKLMAEKNNAKELTADAKEAKPEVEKEEAEESKKIKVNEAALSLGMDVNDFLVKLEELGHKVKSSTSNIDEEIFDKVKESL